MSSKMDFQMFSNSCFKMNDISFFQVKDPRSRYVAGALKKPMFLLIVFHDWNFNWLPIGMRETMQCECISSSTGSFELSTLEQVDVNALIHFALIKSDLPLGFSFLHQYREKHLSLKRRWDKMLIEVGASSPKCWGGPYAGRASKVRETSLIRFSITAVKNTPFLLLFTLV